MALVANRFPDVRALLGPSWKKETWQLHPGAPSDYVTGGYPLTAGQVELGLLAGAIITGTNAAGQLYAMTPVFPAGSFGTPPQPASAINMVVTLAGVQVASGTDLSSLYWLAEFNGWG
jgi:hypothetical protein